MDSDSEDAEQSLNMEFVNRFEESVSYPTAANFIRGWFNNKKFPSNATEFAGDFPEILNRALHVRNILIDLRKSRGSPIELETDA
jgi:hypothetical protein